MGIRVKIWEDKWFIFPFSFSIFSSRPPDCNYLIVSDLIDAERKCWKSDVIMSLFSEFEANLILSLPISHRLPEDRLIWHFDKKGIFSVKGTYHVAIDLTTGKPTVPFLRRRRNFFHSQRRSGELKSLRKSK